MCLFNNIRYLLLLQFKETLYTVNCTGYVEKFIVHVKDITQVFI